MYQRPLVGVPACMKESTFEIEPGVLSEAQWYHTCGDKYVRTLAEASKVQPVILPSLGELYDFEDLARTFDGFLFTGSPSNVYPAHYGQQASPEHEPHDHWRDNTTLPLIKAVLAAGVPALFVCRGHQELNVAKGGTLTAKLEEKPGKRDHRSPRDPSLDVQYGPNHEIEIAEGSLLAQVLGKTKTIINSVHSQAVDRLGAGLEAEAWADDGTIEAMRVTDAPGFALSLQWHPEYKALQNEDSRKLFAAFGEAVASHAQRRRAQRFTA